MVTEGLGEAAEFASTPPVPPFIVPEGTLADSSSSEEGTDPVVSAQELFDELQRIKADESEWKQLEQFLLSGTGEKGSTISSEAVTEALHKLQQPDIHLAAITTGILSSPGGELPIIDPKVPTDELMRTLDEIERRIKLNRDRTDIPGEIRKRTTEWRNQLEREKGKIWRELDRRQREQQRELRDSEKEERRARIKKEKDRQRWLPGIDWKAVEEFTRIGIPVGVGLLILIYLAANRRQRMSGSA